MCASRFREGSTTALKAEADGFKVMSVAEGAAWADMMMMATPDELQSGIYKDHVEANIRDGANHSICPWLECAFWFDRAIEKISTW